MPRVKIDLLEKGMRVVSDVKNMDDMLLIPAGATLTERQIDILQAWGIEEIDVQKVNAGHDTDPVATLAPEVIAKLSAELKALFWQPDETDPVFAEIFKLMLRRNARKAVFGSPS